MPTFKALANQTAIALSNILQAERLRALYQADIDRYEQERLGLALDLHDSILNQLAVLMMNVDDASLTPQFQEAYDGLTQRLREIVSDLRPPMLSYGLKPALEGLADRLMEHSGDTVQVQAEIQTGKDECRYDPKLELHLFRIIQEASENALQHAQARHIRISGRLDPDQIELGLSDDGTGFEISNGLDLDTLLANKHFGLAGMIERAAIIGAEVQIDSGPGHGTTIRLSWKQSPQ
jgi:signal transduction histidine kinase